MKNQAKIKKEKRERRHRRVRAKVFGTKEQPRLSVFKSSRYVYAQLIDDERGVTLAAANSFEKALRKKKKTEAAAAVGEAIAVRAKKKKISKAAFDRGGFLYAGRIKKVADAAREAGLKF